ncbi:MAG TPA: PH domain-containing protein [Pirellulales bacterium]|jgi:hypothetical protein|nr:PH domain-containing protein [Pirellulales bacterium]
MKQAIAGVAPPALGEVTIMTVWPSLAATKMGRFLGRQYENQSGFEILGIPVTVGRIIALLSIPIVLPGFFFSLLPCFIWLPKLGPFPGVYVPNNACRRYRLTNRRVIIEHATSGQVQAAVSLEDFDAIDVEVLPGQAWYPAGELIFRRGNVETFRLSGVPRPETFRHTCLKAQRADFGVKQASARQLVEA